MIQGPSSSSSASASSTMQRTCRCPLSALQWISLCLNQDTLPFDSILQLGSELTTHIKTVLECPRCSATRRMAQVLSQTISRLVCFYEAVYLSAATSLAGASKEADDPYIINCFVPQTRHPHPHPHSHHHQYEHHRISAPPTSPPAGTDSSAAPACRSVLCEMKLGKLPLQGPEARMLIEAVLVEACLDLNERIQEWKLVVDEMDEQPEDQQGDSISRCLDRLAKLTGLLQFDGLPLSCS